MHSNWRRTIALFGALMLVVVAACGDSGEPGTEPEPTDTTAAATTTSPAPEPTTTTAPAPASTAAAGTPGGRIEFAPGDFGAIVADAIPVDGQAEYLLAASAGQSMILELFSLEDTAVFNVAGPSGTPLASAETKKAILLPESGDYRIVIDATRGNATYDLFVSVYDTQRVQFDSGTSGTVISDSVVRAERAVYVLRAGAGQVMDLTLTSLEDNAVMDVYGPAGDALATEIFAEVIPLFSDGDYQLVVGGTRGNATYDLSVFIDDEDPLGALPTLRGDGLGIASFGDDADRVIEDLTFALGPPTNDPGWESTLDVFPCSGDFVRFVEWGGLVVTFTDGETSFAPAGTRHFTAWYTFDGELSTVDGIVPSISTVADLETRVGRIEAEFDDLIEEFYAYVGGGPDVGITFNFETTDPSAVITRASAGEFPCGE